MDNWIKVSKEPKHEKSVLAIVPDDEGSHFAIAHYDENKKRWFDDSDYDEIIYPTHWQPLPPKPTN